MFLTLKEKNLSNKHDFILNKNFLYLIQIQPFIVLNINIGKYQYPFHLAIGSLIGNQTKSFRVRICELFLSIAFS